MAVRFHLHFSAEDAFPRDSLGTTSPSFVPFFVELRTLRAAEKTPSLLRTISTAESL